MAHLRGVNLLALEMPECADGERLLVRRWLFEAWLIRIRWLALIPGLPLLPLFPHHAKLQYGSLLLGAALCNWWLSRMVGTKPDAARLQKASLFGTAVDWTAVLSFLGLSAGTETHAILPAGLLLLMLGTGFRFGLPGLIGAALVSLLQVGVVVPLHVVALEVLMPGDAVQIALGWVTLIATSALVMAGMLRAVGDWHRYEGRRSVRQDVVTMRLKAGITSREGELLPWLARTDLTYEQIARELHISPETVKSHVRHLGAKLNATGRRQVVEAARRQGLFDPEAPHRSESSPMTARLNPEG